MKITIELPDYAFDMFKKGFYLGIGRQSEAEGAGNRALNSIDLATGGIRRCVYLHSEDLSHREFHRALIQVDKVRL